MRTGLSLYALLMSCACIPEPELHPKAPGDECMRECPDGTRCYGALYKQRIRGHCKLDAGRCAVDGDCGRTEKCIRNTEALGLCGPEVSKY